MQGHESYFMDMHDYNLEKYSGVLFSSAIILVLTSGRQHFRAAAPLKPLLLHQPFSSFKIT